MLLDFPSDRCECHLSLNERYLIATAKNGGMKYKLKFGKLIKYFLEHFNFTRLDVPESIPQLVWPSLALANQMKCWCIEKVQLEQKPPKSQEKIV